MEDLVFIFLGGGVGMDMRVLALYNPNVVCLPAKMFCHFTLLRMGNRNF